jgi:hypothetical protein
MGVWEVMSRTPILLKASRGLEAYEFRGLDAVEEARGLDNEELEMESVNESIRDSTTIFIGWYERLDGTTCLGGSSF